MQDRNEYQQTHRLAPLRQHYTQANAQQKPRVPHWVKGLVIIACIGLAGALTGCGGGGESSAPIADARAYVQSLPDWWQYATDGVHATSEGYSAVTRNALAPVLFPLVAAARCKTGA